MASLASTDNAPVPFGFKNPDGSWPIEGYHIIFNPTFVDMCLFREGLLNTLNLV